jgi:hypothetical protein
MDIKETGLNGKDWTDLDQETNRWWWIKKQTSGGGLL